MSDPGSVCAACGLPGHRYGRNEGMDRFDPIACINQLRGELEKRTLPGFAECPECEGDGIGLAWPDDAGTEPYPCESCSGVGVVPGPETVEAVADALADLPYDTLELRNWGDEPVPYVHVVVARAALLAYAQHAKETE